MKVAAASTLLFATLALASPAPVAQPEALSQPIIPIDAPVVNPAHEFNARTLAARAKPKKPKFSSSDGNNTANAAVSMTPSRVVQLGALGVGVMEVVRLWG